MPHDLWNHFLRRRRRLQVFCGNGKPQAHSERRSQPIILKVLMLHNVLLTDYAWANLDIERAILRAAGADLTIAEKQDAASLANLAPDCDAKGPLVEHGDHSDKQRHDGDFPACFEAARGPELRKLVNGYGRAGFRLSRFATNCVAATDAAGRLYREQPAQLFFLSVYGGARLAPAGRDSGFELSAGADAAKTRDD